MSWNELVIQMRFLMAIRRIGYGPLVVLILKKT